MTRTNCNRELLSGFISNRLDEEDRLDFLLHLDECPNCWEQLFSLTKAQHPHFYKSPSRRKIPIEIDLNLTDNEQDRSEEEEEEVFEVA